MRREQQHLPKAEKIIIKNNKKTNTTKFKLRTPKYLLTLKIDDKKKAEKIMNSIPASKSELSLFHSFTTYYRPQEGATQVSTVHGSVTNERTIICVLRKTTFRVTTALNHTHTSESEGYPSLRSRSFFSPSSLLDLSCGLVPSDFPSVVF